MYILEKITKLMPSDRDEEIQINGYEKGKLAAIRDFEDIISLEKDLTYSGLFQEGLRVFGSNEEQNFLFASAYRSGYLFGLLDQDKEFSEMILEMFDTYIIYGD